MHKMLYPGRCHWQRGGLLLTVCPRDALISYDHSLSALSAADQTFSISFVDTSTEYNEKFGDVGSPERAAKVQEYYTKVCRMTYKSD